jgi:hypothetical protein
MRYHLLDGWVRGGAGCGIFSRSRVGTQEPCWKIGRKKFCQNHTLGPPGMLD